VSIATGTVIAGDFRILSALAEGGMGELYVAQQLSTGKNRALKLMKPELLQDPTLLARFEQEARVSSLIRSDHVVEVVGAGIDPTLQRPWLAMELLDGETLASLLSRRGRLPAHEARVLFAQLCHGLGAAHAARIVHRDLKPENVFIARTQQVGVDFRVKILDFGIA
jgi:serine/threonine protein kinase